MRALAAFLLALPLVACENDGPIERAAEEIDEAVEDVAAGGETTGNAIDDAIDEAVEDVEDVEDAIE